MTRQSKYAFVPHVEHFIVEFGPSDNLDAYTFRVFVRRMMATATEQTDELAIMEATEYIDSLKLSRKHEYKICSNVSREMYLEELASPILSVEIGAL